MHELVSKFENFWVRLATVAIIVVLLALVVIPGPVWSSFILKGLATFGVHVMCVVGAAIIAWLAYDRRVFYWLAGVSVGGLVALQLFVALVAQPHLDKKAASKSEGTVIFRYNGN